MMQLSIYMFSIVSFLLLMSLTSCQNNKPGDSETKLFTLISANHSQVAFTNTIRETADFHVLNYYYAYNGGGVAIGDVDNDGLQDLFFTSNQGANGLYLNKGDFEFEDVTAKSGLEDPTGWTTGVNMMDVNNDGWLDIYVCKSASLRNPRLRENKLYVNQGDGTFKDQAQEWGLADNGFSVQSYFFDYDRDQDLDMFLLNHRVDFLHSVDLDYLLKDDELFPETSNHLYRNDGSYFTDVTRDAGLANKEFGLSAAIGDYNEDGWLDIYVANDFITPDRLYINESKGTFSDQIRGRLQHISYSSMGSDWADVNNDKLPELLVLDMSAEDHIRGKQNMPSMNTSGFHQIVDAGYHYPYMSNMLNLNRGNGVFSDFAQVAGLAKTDWSWAPLIADFDNDGWKDVFVTNGIKREIANQDFGHFLDHEEDSLGKMSIHQVLARMPSEKLKNYSFRNNSDLTFSQSMQEWGLDHFINSNGAAYGDLDNDGDLDLVLNNMEDPASIYRNNSSSNFVSVTLKGSEKNLLAVGTKVTLKTSQGSQYQELFLSRGYQSSVFPRLNFGIGEEEIIQRIEVVWPDGSVSLKEDVKPNRHLVFNYKDAMGQAKRRSLSSFFSSVDPMTLGIDFKHVENEFNDFSSQVLLPQMLSHQGPPLEVADVNGDERMDVWMGGAKGQSGVLYVQNASGSFDKRAQPAFEKEEAYEDTGGHFFDADLDGDMDLYVGSGGYEFKESDPLLQDRLYLNDGNGVFEKDAGLPLALVSTKAIISLDYDQDDDPDLVVFGRLIPGKYPLVPPSFFLKNNGGKFTDVTDEVISELSEIGLVNDAIATDFDGDDDLDLIVVGEWMPITILENMDGQFNRREMPTLVHTNGWWNTVAEVDFDKDGDLDYFVGNLGSNNKFHPSEDKPLHVFANHFDGDEKFDMVLSKDYQEKLVPIRGKECSTEQNPFVSERIKTFSEFANSSITEIYGANPMKNALHKTVDRFESIYLENIENSSFKIHELPPYVQLGPTMSFEFLDVNQDGHLDVVGVGAIHEAEVETVRYDGNLGYVLLGDSKGGMKPHMDAGFINLKNAKSMVQVELKGSNYLLIANNDECPVVFKVK